MTMCLAPADIFTRLRRYFHIRYVPHTHLLALVAFEIKKKTWDDQPHWTLLHFYVSHYYKRTRTTTSPPEQLTVFEGFFSFLLALT